MESWTVVVRVTSLQFVFTICHYGLHKPSARTSFIRMCLQASTMTGVFKSWQRACRAIHIFPKILVKPVVWPVLPCYFHICLNNKTQSLSAQLRPRHSFKTLAGPVKSRWSSRWKKKVQWKSRFGKLTQDQLPQDSAVLWHMRWAVSTATPHSPKYATPPICPSIFTFRYIFILPCWPSMLREEWL